MILFNLTWSITTPHLLLNSAKGGDEKIEYLNVKHCGQNTKVYVISNFFFLSSFYLLIYFRINWAQLYRTKNVQYDNINNALCLRFKYTSCGDGFYFPSHHKATHLNNYLRSKYNNFCKPIKIMHAFFFKFRRIPLCLKNCVFNLLTKVLATSLNNRCFVCLACIYSFSFL